MAEPSDQDAALRAVPPDLYEQLAPVLNICGMACMQLFARPHDPLPQEITELTGLDMAETRLITAIHSNQALARQLLEAPEMLYAYLVVGRLVLISPLAGAVLDYLLQQTSMGKTELAALRQQAIGFGAGVAALVGNYLSGGDADVREELEVLRQQVEDAFRQLAGTTTAVNVAANEEEIVLETAFSQLQLRMMQLATAVLQLLPTYSHHAFAQALNRLRAAPGPAVAAMQQRLLVAQPEEYLTFSLPDVALLYQATQVLGMVLTTHLFDELLAASPVPEMATLLDRNSAPQLQLICALIEEYGGVCAGQLRRRSPHRGDANRHGRAGRLAVAPGGHRRGAWPGPTRGAAIRAAALRC